MTRQLRIEPDGIAIDMADHETILQAARRAGVALPYECGWGSCGTCKVTLVAGQVDLAGIDPGAFTPTFVVVDQGREIGRIRGYPGDAFFFGLLGRIMNATSGAPARS